MKAHVSSPFPKAPSVALWLWLVCTLIITMVGVGGVTRLTESGLSMMDWRPVMGWIPPRTQVEWQEKFDLYKEGATAQYEKFSADREMTLSDFQEIFFWEYMHRVLGRLIGLAYALPLAWYLLRWDKTKKLRLSFRNDIPVVWRIRLFLGLILGGLQGVMGWYMVQSGFSELTSVSHMRLAAHLCLAMFVFCYLLWMIFDLQPFWSHRSTNYHKLTGLRFATLGVLALLILQIVYGAFTAGLRAGYTYNTYPKMESHWIAPEVFSDRYDSFTESILYNPATVQFIHRHLGLLVVLAVLGLWYYAQQIRLMERQALAFNLLLGLVNVQFVLGVTTLVTGMNHTLAVSHQVSACFLLGTLIWAFHEQLRPRGLNVHSA